MTFASEAGDARSKVRHIAVAGNPNSGKTTLFNRLTGLRQRVANYPGVTVEKREGRLSGTDIILLDLPGAYSLSARSPDEEIARDVLLGRRTDTPRPDAVLLVIDASNLERNLYFATQLIEFGTPLVIACNMIDAAESRGDRIDCDALSRELGVPVIPTSARAGTGVDAVRTALRDMTLRETAPHKTSARPWKLPQTFEAQIDRAAGALAATGIEPIESAPAAALLWLTDELSGDVAGTRAWKAMLEHMPPEHAAEARSAADSIHRAYPNASEMVIEARYHWIAELGARVVRPARGDASAPAKSLTDRIDAVVTHRIWGTVVFAIVMFLLFLSIFSWAKPLMDMIEAGQTALASWSRSLIPEGPVQSLVTDGVIAGVGSVVVFFPQICILFLFLSILEDSGYMARAAFLMDRMMSRVGLHGRSFIPLLSSYACAIPGIMATRTVENRRDRLTTILIAPLMSCSARLPVYLIVIAAVFGDRLWLKAGVMFGMYALGTITALVMAVIFKKTLLKGPTPTFIMELPPYHLPQVRSVIRTMWDRSKLFLTGAGTTIFAVCIVIWALCYFPRLDATALPPEVQARIAETTGNDESNYDNVLASEQRRQSYLGRMGRFIEPAIEPLGYDWRLGVGILSSFFAREVFVGTMGIVFSVGEADESSEALRERLAAAEWPDGRVILTPRVGVGLMVFYVLACQCVSTLAIVRRETGTWKWPAFMFAYMSVLAYGGALAVNKLGATLGWA